MVKREAAKRKKQAMRHGGEAGDRLEEVIFSCGFFLEWFSLGSNGKQPVSDLFCYARIYSLRQRLGEAASRHDSNQGDAFNL